MPPGNRLDVVGDRGESPGFGSRVFSPRISRANGVMRLIDWPDGSKRVNSRPLPKSGKLSMPLQRLMWRCWQGRMSDRSWSVLVPTPPDYAESAFGNRETGGT
jgi:hypothetical protein